MKNYGFIRVAAAVPVIKVANIRYNTEEICRLTSEAFDKKVSLVVFPELSLTGSTCGDLTGLSTILNQAEKGVRELIEFSRGKSTAIVVGTPVYHLGQIYNCAAVIRNGSIKGLVPKIHISSDGFTFASGSALMPGAQIKYAGQECTISPNILFDFKGFTFAVEVGEDANCPMPQSAFHALAGAMAIAHPSADSEVVLKDARRRQTLSENSARGICGYIHAGAGFGESTQDCAYAGAAGIYEAGQAVEENERFQMESMLTIADLDLEKIANERAQSGSFKCYCPDGKSNTAFNSMYTVVPMGDLCATDFEEDLYRFIEPHPFTPFGQTDDICREAVDIQVNALAKRLSHIGCKTAVIGISGGLDSTLALLSTALTFDRLGWSRDRIIGITMPGYGTTSRTKSNASELMDALGITSREISIAAACDQHFADIEHDPAVHDAAYENAQARERTQILMDVANQTGGIVIGTGDLSELALGWATYNGDHMSMYGLNAGIPKTMVRSMVEWIADNRFFKVKSILMDIIDTPISPELLPAAETGEIQQVTEDLVGPYELHDFFLYHFIRHGYSPEKIYFLARKALPSYDDKTIQKWLKTFIRRFFSQQFKRSCLPDGPQVTSVSLSPRGAWHMPSDAYSDSFLETL